MHLPPAPPIHDGMNYAVVRRIVLAHGWKPLYHKNDSDAMCNLVGKNEGMYVVCKKFPEIDDCTGGGPLFCRLQFYKGNGKLLIITGSPPGYPTKLNSNDLDMHNMPRITDWGVSLIGDDD
jgi:hypothetical protein